MVWHRTKFYVYHKFFLSTARKGDTDFKKQLSYGQIFMQNEADTFWYRLQPYFTVCQNNYGFVFMFSGTTTFFVASVIMVFVPPRLKSANHSFTFCLDGADFE